MLISFRFYNNNLYEVRDDISNNFHRFNGLINIGILILISLLSILLLMNFNYPRFISETINTMTFNIRLDLASDGENAWSYRKQIAADVFTKFNIDIAGVQEALFNQIEDLDTLLPEYNWFGAGRSDGKKDGELSAIFYKKDKLELIKGNTFWLSEKPSEPGSVGWDAALTRICTWGEFRDINSGKTFYYFNTHFDHKGETARQKGAELILDSINAIAGDNPVILTGDFNCTKTSNPYKIITNNKTYTLSDANFAEGVKTSGPDWTFHGFNSVDIKDREKIDFIFISKNIKVISHSILDYKEKGKYPSDHLPISADVEIQ